MPAPTLRFTFVGDGSTKSFAIGFSYLNRADVNVSVGGVPTTAFDWVSPFTISFHDAPASGAAVVIERITSTDTLASSFTAGALSTTALNRAFSQLLYAFQEAKGPLVQVKLDTYAARDVALVAEAAAQAAQVLAEAAAVQAAGAVGFNLDTVTDLAAVSNVISSNVRVVYVRGRSTVGDGGAGVFNWSGDDISALCTMDTYKAIYVAPSGETGSNGGWVRDTKFLSPDFWGVSKDGLVDVQPQLQAMWSFNDGKRRDVIIGGGTYLMNAGLIPRDDLRVIIASDARIKRNYSGTTGLLNGISTTPYKNLRISGGIWGDPTLTFTGPTIRVWADDSVISDILVDGFVGGLAFTWGGDRSVFRDLKSQNTAAAAGNGGMRCIGGKLSYAIGCRIVSGDDALQFVPSPLVTASPSPSTNLDIHGCAYIACYAESLQGRAFIVAMRPTVGVSTMTASIRDVAFVACTGKCPQTGGSSTTQGVLVWNNSTASSGDISGVTFEGGCSVDMLGNGNTTGAVELQNDTGRPTAVRNINGRIRILNTVGNALVAENISDSTLAVDADVPSNFPAGSRSAVYLNNCSNVEVGGNVGVGTGQVALRTDGTCTVNVTASFYGFANTVSTFNLLNLNAAGRSRLRGCKFIPNGSDTKSRILVGASADIEIDVDWTLCGTSLDPVARISVTADGKARFSPATRGIGYAHYPTTVDTSVGTGSITPTIDTLLSTDFTITLNQSITIQCPPAAQCVGRHGSIRLIQDGTGGRTVGFDAGVFKLPTAALTLNSAAGAETYYEYRVVAPNIILITQPWK